MFLVGLSGGIATGKSTVSAMLKESGVNIIDADLIARQIVEPEKKAWKLIKRHFGDDVIESNGHINRAKLAEIIFESQEKRRLINSITHPEIYKEILRQCIVLFLKINQFVVIDLPLLFESGYMIKYLYKTIVVRCNDDQQIARLMNRNGYTRDDALLRINAQMPLNQKCQIADYVVDNGGTIDDTRRQLQLIVEDLRSSYAHWKLRIFFIFGIFIIFGSIFYVIYKFII